MSDLFQPDLPGITITGEFYSSKRVKMVQNRKTGKFFPMKNDNAYHEFEEFMYQLQQLRPEWEKMKADKPYPLRVQFKLYRSSRKRFDFINIIQNIADAMTKSGYIPDDNANFFCPVFVPYEVDKDNPRCIITIL